MQFDYIEDNLIRLKQKIKKTCDSCGRDPKEIYIIAVSKTFPADAVASALDYNQLDFGENRVQEMVEKEFEFRDRIIHWHLIGHLQTNKVKFVVPFVFLIHSLDSLKLAQKIQAEASKAGRIVKCLIQVNTSEENQKSGCDPRHVVKLVREISAFENIRLRGLMTIGKIIDDPKDETQKNIVRKNFRALRELYDEVSSLKIERVEMKYLSMGMTSDYEIAIEEGSNMLRIGSAIFGERKV